MRMQTTMKTNLKYKARWASKMIYSMKNKRRSWETLQVEQGKLVSIRIRNKRTKSNRPSKTMETLPINSSVSTMDNKTLSTLNSKNSTLVEQIVIGDKLTLRKRMDSFSSNYSIKETPRIYLQMQTLRMIKVYNRHKSIIINTSSKTWNSPLPQTVINNPQMKINHRFMWRNSPLLPATFIGRLRSSLLYKTRRLQTKEDPYSRGQFKILKIILLTTVIWLKVPRCNFSNRIIRTPNIISHKILSSRLQTHIRVIINSTVAKIPKLVEIIKPDHRIPIITTPPNSQDQLQKIWCQCRLEFLMGRTHLIMFTTILPMDTEIVITVLTKTPQLHKEHQSSSSLAEVIIPMLQMEELAVRTMIISSILLIKMYHSRILVWNISVKMAISSWGWVTTALAEIHFMSVTINCKNKVESLTISLWEGDRKNKSTVDLEPVKVSTKWCLTFRLPKVATTWIKTKATLSNPEPSPVKLMLT